jgi:hypothetical protein
VIWYENHWDGLLVVLPQNHWDGFFRFGLKTGGDGFSWFNLKIGGFGFPGLCLKTSGYSLMICASKSPWRFLDLSLKIKRATFCRFRQKTNGMMKTT